MDTQIVSQSPQGTLTAYLSEVANRSGSTRTSGEYGRVVTRFLSTVDDPLNATPAHVHAYAYGPGPTGREAGPSTINMRLNALRGFYGFLVRMGMVTSNPADAVKRPQANRPIPRGLSGDEVRRLLAAIPDTVAGKRTRALVVTCVLTGLRRSEVMSLRKGDLKRNGGVYYVVKAKGGVQRHRELPPPAFVAILDLLAAEGRHLETMAHDDRLFEVSAQGFYLNLKRAARKAKLPGVTIHSLRHSAAQLRRETGASLEDVQSLLGHASIATTARYLQRLEGAEDDGWQGVALALGLT